MRPLLLGSIPSPSSNAIEIGPLELRAYGLAIAVGVLVAIRIAGRRFAARGGEPEAISSIALWAVPAGLVGARLYHVATDFHRFDDDPLRVFQVWKGGLGIPGGLLGGVLVGVLVARKRGLRVAELLDVAAPAIPVAQAIGRLGNWFNQELFGRPTDLPWALEIDRDHRPAGYLDEDTYHPTFLYEALWNVALAAILVRVERRWRLPAGQLFVLYVGGYFLGRLWVESLRIDPATEVGGVRINIVVSAVVVAVAAAVFVSRQRRASRDGEGAPFVAGAAPEHEGT
ncbi:MAG TPA: prolipoprotein diacylglyceryl transferase [Acidimicrobiales bacterium]|nr:prolipoprotein diacylglyceryl transferase [Acidimicrobiales bacterium]